MSGQMCRVRSMFALQTLEKLVHCQQMEKTDD